MSFNDLNQIDGLQFIPVDEKKRPLVKNWQTAKVKYDLSGCHSVGLVCGEPSGNVEVIDFDLKYDISGKIYEHYKRIVYDYDPNILKKLVVQKTKNGGYHFIYRCQKIEGNQKLANRPTTVEEKQATYDDTYRTKSLEGKSDEEAKKVAKKAHDNDKVRVLIESRGLGGQVVVDPSEGYKFIFGDLCSISEITPEERDVLFNVARQFNQVFEEVREAKGVVPKSRSGLSPFEDYNERADVVGLLEQHGWKFVQRHGSKSLMLRPGNSSAKTSGNFDHDKNWFSVFTTSTEFEPQKAYRPYAVFAFLECNGDFSLAAKKLYEMGYGDRDEEKPKPEKQSTRQIYSRISMEDDDLSFLATPEDYDPYIQQVLDGTLPQGLTTGSPLLDKHLPFKENQLVMVNGLPNVGKTVSLWWWQMISALYHDWKWVIYSSENTIGSCMRKLMQFYWGKPLVGKGAQTEQEMKIAKNFVEKHFFIVKSQEALYNYKDIINMVKKVRDKHPDVNNFMIDPYNSLKTDLSGFSKLSTHDYHYEALSELKFFGQATKTGIVINSHAVTESMRKVDGDGYPAAPMMADTEGGGKNSNKADDFVTLHRKTQHPTEWMITEWHIRKIKDTETGGSMTPLLNPVKFRMTPNQSAFIEWQDGLGEGIDPIAHWHNLQKFKQDELDFAPNPPLSKAPVSFEDTEDYGDRPF